MALWTVPLKTTTLTVFTVEAKNRTEAAVLAGQKAVKPADEKDPTVSVRVTGTTWLPAEKVIED